MGTAIRLLLSILGLLLKILGAMTGIVLIKNLWLRKVRNRAFNKFFGPIREHRVLIVCPSQKQAEGLPNVATTYEDAMAQSIVVNQFERYGIDYEIRLHRDLQIDERSEHLFLICGPVSNSITRAFLEVTNLPFRFSNSKGTSRDARGWADTRNWVIEDSSGRQVHGNPTINELDFAIIAKVRNPWSRSDKGTYVYLVAGIEGLGTWGAAYMLTNRVGKVNKRLREAERISSSTNFAAVVTVKSGTPQPDVSLLETKVV